MSFHIFGWTVTLTFATFVYAVEILIIAVLVYSAGYFLYRLVTGIRETWHKARERRRWED